MNRDKELITKRRNFVKEFFNKIKGENPKITIKEIAQELADWYLFVSVKTIRRDYHYKLG